MSVYCSMDIVEISKILSNELRVNILHWLKDPEANFPPHTDLKHFNDGVCVQYIGTKAGIAQSTVSQYLSWMQKAGLVIATRHGKWTYYRRNEEAIAKYIKHLSNNL